METERILYKGEQKPFKEVLKIGQDLYDQAVLLFLTPRPDLPVHLTNFPGSRPLRQDAIVEASFIPKQGETVQTRFGERILTDIQSEGKPIKVKFRKINSQVTDETRAYGIGMFIGEEDNTGNILYESGNVYYSLTTDTEEQTRLRNAAFKQTYSRFELLAKLIQEGRLTP